MSSNKSILRITSPSSCDLIGMSICPGKVDAFAYSGPCHRNLDEDLDTIAQWGANRVITLLEPEELSYLQVEKLGDEVRKRGMIWHHWPVIDGSALRVRQAAKSKDPWAKECELFLEDLDMGKKLFIHCRGGLGRTGSLAARLLIERGLTPEAAIAEVRVARPGAIETLEQEEYLLKRLWREGF